MACSAAKGRLHVQTDRTTKESLRMVSTMAKGRIFGKTGLNTLASLRMARGMDTALIHHRMERTNQASGEITNHIERSGRTQSLTAQLRLGRGISMELNQAGR